MYAWTQRPAKPLLGAEAHTFAEGQGERTNTRTKDLVDMVLLIGQGKLDKHRVRTALVATFAKRATHESDDEFRKRFKLGILFAHGWEDSNAGERILFQITSACSLPRDGC
jgi:hypothetical protein